MNNITYAVSVDVNNPIIPYNVYVANVLDSNVRYLEITLYQNGNAIALSNEATATASLVTDDVLVDDSVECTISNNIITVPLEDLQRHGNLDVQVTVTEGTKVLAIPFPIQVRVTPNIAENAQIDENSSGSYAEVVHEIAEARGSYDKLKDRLDHTAADIADVNTALAAKEDKSNKAARITSSNIGSGTNYPTVAAVAQYLLANYYNKNDIDDSTYTKLEVDTALAAKANTADVNTALAAKAEKSTVDSITENPDFFVLNSQTLDGVTVTDNGDGTYTFNGTNTATTLFQAFLLSAGRYTASAEILSGTATNQFAVKYGSNNETWVSTNIASATVLFTTATAVYFRLNLGTFTNFKLKISIEKENAYTAIDTVARAANSAAQAQLVSLSAQAGPLYPLVEPDGFTWKNSPLHGKILTDFRGVYQVDFDVASYKNNPGKVLYVSPDGSDSNAGTPDAPLANMSTAYNNGADTIYLYPGKYYRPATLFGTEINRDLNIIGLGDGVILSPRVKNIPNTSPNVTEYSTGVWRCYSNGTTYLSNVVDIAHKTADGHYTKYTQLPSKMEVLMTSGSWALVTETIDGNDKTVAYIHTLSGENPLAGDDVLLLYSPAPSSNPTTGTKYPLFMVTGGKVYLENLTCIEGSAPLFAQKQNGGSDIEVYAKNCKFFYSRTVDYDVCMLQGVSLAIFQNCEASFGMKDGFNYHARSGIIPKAVEINCIGIGNGNIEDSNDQGSTIHDGGSIIRVRDVCAHNYGANYSDQGTGTESWNIGCVGFESWCPSNGQNADFFALLNTKMFLDGCVSFGSKHNFNYASPDENSEDEAGAIYLRCMVENVANKVTSITSASTDEQYPSAKAVYDAIDSAIVSQTTDLSAAVVTLSESSYTYDGTSKVPSVTSVTLNGQTLTVGTDYAVVSYPATNAGSYALTVNGIGSYSGTVTANWTIAKAQATISGADSISVVGIGESQSETYTTTGDGTMSFSISDSSVATISNSSGQVIVTGVAAGSATLTVTATDGTNYTGTTKTVSVAVTETSANTVFGVMWDYSLNSPALTRLTSQTDPLGVVTDCPTNEPTACVGTTGGQSDFDNYMPWAGMVRKNYVNGQVVDFTGYDNGETYVFIPEFWVKLVDDSEHNKKYFYISSSELTGFTKHPGSGGYVGRYLCDVNFESKPNGYAKTNISLADFRTGIRSVSDKRFAYDAPTYEALIMLIVVEWADFNLQNKIGYGVASGYFNAKPLGETDTLIYHTGRTNGSYSDSAIQYRWIENIYYNVWHFLDGILINDRNVYICSDRSKYADTITNDYVDTGIALSATNGWIKNVQFLGNTYLFPTEVGGSNTTYLCDQIAGSSGLRCCLCGYAAKLHETAGGLFSLDFTNAPSLVNSTVGTRPVFESGGDA